MSKAATALKNDIPSNQIVGLFDGNEMAAMAAKQINFHIMGYYPITPSTQIAETLDAMKAEGLHDVVMIPGDGEHGAAGICFGASTAGGRVVNATSANGLLYSMEQLPVQSGSRYPMVLNLVTRSVSGPLDIKCDHSDLYMALNTGWIMLIARDAQQVYDMNIMAVKIGEHKDVRLPVMVVQDGFFGSHQKRRVMYFKNDDDVRSWLGPVPQVNVSIDPDRPLTIGPYMNEPDLINNKYQLHLGMEAARRVIPEVFEEYGKLSGRTYPVVEAYRLDDAEVGLFILNSPVETAKESVDRMRKKGKKVGLITLNVLRPFPADELTAAVKHLKALVVADRADSYGSGGGNMTHEIRSALKLIPDNRTLVMCRIYGIGGREFYVEDGETLLEEGLKAAADGRMEKPFDYYGAFAGEEKDRAKPALPPLTEEEQRPGIISVEKKDDGKLLVKGTVPRKLTKMPRRIVSGHGACPGCGIFTNLNIFLKAIEGPVVLQFHTGCGMVVTTGYPYTAFRTTYIHNLFQNGAATLSGVVEMFNERKRRGEIPSDKEITFILVTGDGGHDIGIGPSLGAAARNHRMIILEYDNEGYMNTGHQLSFTTPKGHGTSTSHVGPAQLGKRTHHKDTAQIFAATGIPYVFTAAESNYVDMLKKAAKAAYYSREGLVFGKVLSTCPLNWRTPDDAGNKIIQAAVDSCFFPLYEVEHGKTTITYDPEKRNKKVPVSEWLKLMGKTKHLLKPENESELADIQAEIDRRWERLKAKHEHPIL